MTELLSKMKQDSPIVFPPNDTQKNWNKRFNMEWLKLRNLDSSGNATELRTRVKSYMDSDNCPKIPENTTKVTNEELVRLYASTSNLVSNLLAYSVNDHHIEICNLFVKRYLNDLETVDKKLRVGNDKPIWCQKYNLICLLNCKEDMKRYGPCRIRWEGDDSGGKNIQTIKTSFTGFNLNWQIQTHQRYLRKKTMSKLNSTVRSKDIDSEDFNKKSIIHVYRSAERFLSEYHLGKPIMIVRVKDEGFGVIHSGNKFWKFDKIEYVGIFTYICRFVIKLNVQDETNISKHITEDMIQNICIAIPNLEKTQYAIIDMEWRELNNDMKFTYGYL